MTRRCRSGSESDRRERKPAASPNKGEQGAIGDLQDFSIAVAVNAFCPAHAARYVHFAGGDLVEREWTTEAGVSSPIQRVARDLFRLPVGQGPRICIEC